MTAPMMIEPPTATWPNACDDVAGVALAEHEAGRRDVEAEAEQRRDEQQRREDREVERLLHEHRREQDHERQQDVEDDQHVEHRRRHRHDEQQHDPTTPTGTASLGSVFFIRRFLRWRRGGRARGLEARGGTGAGDGRAGDARAFGTASAASDSGVSTVETSSAWWVGGSRGRGHRGRAARLEGHHEGEDAGDRRVEVDGDLLAEVAGGVQRPGRAGCPRPSARLRPRPSRGSCAATAPAPFATTRGADLPGSYLRATAKWVGLTITTSASAIAPIMRLRLIASWRERRCDLISGSPSVLLFSSRTSFLVMRVFLRLRRMTTKTSAAARRRPATTAGLEQRPPVPAAAASMSAATLQAAGAHQHGHEALDDRTTARGRRRRS